MDLQRPTRQRPAGPAKVLLVTSSLGVGGAEAVVRDLVRTLNPERFKACVCCLEWFGPIGRELAAEGVEIFLLDANNKGKRGNYFAGLKLRRFVLDNKIDIIHSHTTRAFADAAMCRTLTRGVRLVHTFHFGNYPHKRGGELWIERTASRFADRLIAVGRVQREQIKAAHALRDGAIGVIRNGVAVPTSATGDPSFRAGLGAEGGVLVGTIATLIRQKGLFDLLATARRVRDVRDDVRFVVVGDGHLRPELLQKRRELGLDDVVSFPGWLGNAASQALPTFDIYFQPSLWEAMSISILEAMAAGKPVVSTLVGEAPQLIEQGHDGDLFPAGDIVAMSDAILSLAADPDRRRRIGHAAAEKVTTQLTVDHMVRAHEDLYRDMLPHRQREELRVAG